MASLNGASFQGLSLFPYLRIVNLNNNNLTAEGIRELANVKFEWLDTLSLGNCNLIDKMLQPILSRNFENLRRLDLSNNELTDLSIRRFVKFKRESLEVLSVESTFVGDEGARLIINKLAGLQMLLLRRTNITSNLL